MAKAIEATQDLPDKLRTFKQDILTHILEHKVKFIEVNFLIN